MTDQCKQNVLDAVTDCRSVVAFVVDDKGTATAFDCCDEQDFADIRRVLRNLNEHWNERFGAEEHEG